jgi:hypothetical protein
MNTCSGVRSSRSARLFSFGLLDGLPVRLRRPYVRAASAGFRLECLATAFMNSPDWGLRRSGITWPIIHVVRAVARPGSDRVRPVTAHASVARRS